MKYREGWEGLTWQLMNYFFYPPSASILRRGRLLGGAQSEDILWVSRKLNESSIVCKSCLPLPRKTKSPGLRNIGRYPNVAAGERKGVSQSRPWHKGETPAVITNTLLYSQRESGVRRGWGGKMTSRPSLLPLAPPTNKKKKKSNQTGTPAASAGWSGWFAHSRQEVKKKKKISRQNGDRPSSVLSPLAVCCLATANPSGFIYFKIRCVSLGSRERIRKKIKRVQTWPIGWNETTFDGILSGDPFASSLSLPFQTFKALTFLHVCAKENSGIIFFFLFWWGFESLVAAPNFSTSGEETQTKRTRAKQKETEPFIAAVRSSTLTNKRRKNKTKKNCLYTNILNYLSFEFSFR